MPVVSKPGGMPRGSLPKVNSTTLSSTMPSATVAISQELEPRATNGRTATRSTTTPHTAQPASAATTASGSGQPNVTQNVKHSTAPSIMVLPCAKFTVLDTAYVTWKPSANSPYMLPRPSPEMSAEQSAWREQRPVAAKLDRGPQRLVAKPPSPCALSASSGRRACDPLCSIHRDDLVALVADHDVVVGPERVVIVVARTAACRS